jgi:hypothetical protein
LDQRRFPGLDSSAVIIAEPVENVETGFSILAWMVKNMLCRAWEKLKFDSKSVKLIQCLSFRPP